MRPITLISALLASLQLLSGTALAGGGWTWPVRGAVLTRYVNGDDPYAAGQHRGVDIGAPVGTRVVAAAPGTVTFAGVAGSSGLTVSERTADGRFDLSYLHLSGTSVHAGDAVAEGAPLGLVGTSGRRSIEAAHLHFGVREAGQRAAYRDPMDFLAPLPPADAPRPAPSPVPVGEPAAPEPATAEVAAAPAASSPAAAPLPSALASAAPLLAANPAHGPHARAAGVRGDASRPADASSPSSHVGGRAAPLRLLRAQPLGSGAAASPERHRRAAAPGRGPDGARQLAQRGPVRPAAGVPHRGGGVELGWLAACIGLVMAATLLAHPDQARTVARRGRSGLGALTRPARRGAEGGGPPLAAETRR
ncbi:MAG: hypothetical protein QOF55_1848 [Thermoleophilaceae bacterium]|nr:hypothetical protein [Thermoleophilaceae bacterium]